MRKANIENLIRIYEIERRRSTEELKDFFKLNSLFLLIQIGLLGAVEFEAICFPLLCVIGFITAVFWFFANLAQMGWKKWWQGLSGTMMKKVYEKLGLEELLVSGWQNEPKGRLSMGITLLPGLLTLMWGLWGSLADDCFLSWPLKISVVLAVCFVEAFFYLQYYRYKPFAKHLKWNKKAKRR